MPSSVATISSASLCAGTTTATRFASSIGGPLRLAEAALAGDRQDRAEDEPDQGADDERRRLRVRSRLDGSRRLDHLRALDLFRERELLQQRLLLCDQVALARLEVVLLPDDHELLKRVELLL